MHHAFSMLTLVGVITICDMIEPSECTKMCEAAIAAKSREQAGIAYKALFNGADADERLLKLRLDADISMSLNASWQLLKRGNAPLELRDLGRFLGYTEGRIRTRIPSRWMANLVQYVEGKTPQILLSDNYRSLGHMSVTQKTRKSDLGAVVSENVSLSAGDQKITVKVEGFELTVAEDLFNSLIKKGNVDHGLRTLWCAFDDKKAYLLITDGISGGPFRLTAIDRAAKTTLWDAAVWTSPVIRFAGPGNEYTFDLVLNQAMGTIAVFGIGPGKSCCIEGFDLRDGKAKYRFSSNCWDATQE